MQPAQVSRHCRCSSSLPPSLQNATQQLEAPTACQVPIVQPLHAQACFPSSSPLGTMLLPLAAKSSTVPAVPALRLQSPCPKTKMSKCRLPVCHVVPPPCLGHNTNGRQVQAKRRASTVHPPSMSVPEKCHHQITGRCSVGGNGGGVGAYKPTAYHHHQRRKMVGSVGWWGRDRQGLSQCKGVGV